MENNTFTPNNNTVAVPPLDLLKYQLIEQRANVLYNLREYGNRASRTGQPPSNHQFFTSVQILYYMLEPTLERWLEPNEFVELQSLVFDDNHSKNLRGFSIISKWLDKKKVTRIDLENSYDTSSVESENDAKGM